VSYTQLLAAPLYTQLFPSTSIYDREPPSPRVSVITPIAKGNKPLPEDLSIPEQSQPHYAKASALDKNVGPFSEDDEEVIWNPDDNEDENDEDNNRVQPID